MRSYSGSLLCSYGCGQSGHWYQKGAFFHRKITLYCLWF
jgi:hypothetical protein